LRETEKNIRLEPQNRGSFPERTMRVLPGGLLSNPHGLAGSRLIIPIPKGERLGVPELGDQNRKSQKPADDSAGFWLLVGGMRLPMANHNPGTLDRGWLSPTSIPGEHYLQPLSQQGWQHGSQQQSQSQQSRRAQSLLRKPHRCLQQGSQQVSQQVVQQFWQHEGWQQLLQQEGVQHEVQQLLPQQEDVQQLLSQQEDLQHGAGQHEVQHGAGQHSHTGTLRQRLTHTVSGTQTFTCLQTVQGTHSVTV
jgi:hypothetical protein